MGITDEVIEAAGRVAAETGVAAAVLLAVALVETNGVAYAAFEGRREPVIRFEGHYFDRLLSGETRRRARAAGLAAPRAGQVKNPAAQSARWRLLRRAAAIDAAAAFAATSWGLGQVMGAHWKLLGFEGPLALAGEARRSAEGQLAIVALFLKAEGLDLLLPQGATAAFARRYNGPGYLRTGYDRKIAAAFAKAKALLPADSRDAIVPGRGDIAASRTAAGRAPGRAKTVSKGWRNPLAILSGALSWLSLRSFAPTRTRSSSISTGRSSTSRTIRRTSRSLPPPSGG